MTYIKLSENMKLQENSLKTSILTLNIIQFCNLINKM
jgi:hypothetical protein